MIFLAPLERVLDCSLSVVDAECTFLDEKRSEGKRNNPRYDVRSTAAAQGSSKELCQGSNIGSSLPDPQQAVSLHHTTGDRYLHYVTIFFVATASFCGLAVVGSRRSSWCSICLATAGKQGRLLRYRWCSRNPRPRCTVSTILQTSRHDTFTCSIFFLS